MEKRFLVVHVLRNQSLGCANRDDIGDPKTAFVGGCVRGRRSSQNIKRNLREMLEESLNEGAIRTREYPNYLLNKMLEKGISEQKAVDAIVSCIGKSLKHGKDDKKKEIKKDDPRYDSETKRFDISSVPLAFFSNKEMDMVVSKLINGETDSLEKIIKDAGDRCASVALFGRMFADHKDLNIEAVSSYSHALTTNEVQIEQDFFTALDDLSKESGAGMMGDIAYNSGCFYNVAVLNLQELKDLGFGLDEIKNLAELWIKGLYYSFSDSRKNSMFCKSDPCAFRVELTENPISLWDAFDKPVEGPGFVENSIDRLYSHTDFLAKKSKSYASVKAFNLVTKNREGLCFEEIIEGVISELN